MRFSSRERRHFGFISAAVAAIPSLALAQTSYTWETGSGDWNTPTHWTPRGVPGAPGDTATIIPTVSSGLITITYDYTGTASFLNALTMGSASGGTELTTFSMAADTLLADTETIGDPGTVTFSQIGGTNSTGTSGSVYIAMSPGSTGSYSLSGTGSLAAATPTAPMASSPDSHPAKSKSCRLLLATPR